MSEVIQCKHGLDLDTCQTCLPHRETILDELELKATRRIAAGLNGHAPPKRQKPPEPIPEPPKRSPPKRPQPGQPSLLKVVLEAARSLPQPFTRAALVLAAWNLRPEQLGLGERWQEYPDSNKVMSHVYGRRRLIGLGELRVVKGGLFEVVEERHG